MTDTMTAPGVVRTWTLSVGEAEYAITRLTAINDRAARRGLTSRYAWTLGPEQNVPVWDEPRTPGDQPVYYEIVRDLVITGEPPKLAGWTFLAVLTWDEGALVTRCTPGSEARIDASLIRERECDHCHASRDRKDCYLVQHDDGRRLQVGSTCMRDFLGHEFTPGMITYGDTLDEIEGDCAGQGRAEQSARITRVLEWSAAMCAQTGWISRDAADQRMCLSSGDLLRMVLFGGKDRRTIEARRDYQPAPQHVAEAAAVLAWARHLDPADPSEYIANLYRAVTGESEYVSYRNVALVGSAVGAYQRDRARLAADLAGGDPADSQWFGEAGQKFAGLEVTCLDYRVIDGMYLTYKYTFAGADGNRIEWWASSPQEGIKAGTRVILSGTVNPKKPHEEYRGVKATRFTRCKWAAHPDEFAAMMAAHPALAALAQTTAAQRAEMWVGGRQAADRLAAGLLLGDPADIAGWWTRWQAKRDS